jgi:hypothetical protein
MSVVRGGVFFTSLSSRKVSSALLKPLVYCFEIVLPQKEIKTLKTYQETSGDVHPCPRGGTGDGEALLCSSP